MLYNKLLEIDFLSEISETRDEDILTHKVHTEISWFNNNGQLKIKPDISLFEPETLSILDGIDRPIPSKGFHSIGYMPFFTL